MAVGGGDVDCTGAFELLVATWAEHAAQLASWALVRTNLASPCSRAAFITSCLVRTTQSSCMLASRHQWIVLFASAIPFIEDNVSAVRESWIALAKSCTFSLSIMVKSTFSPPANVNQWDQHIVQEDCTLVITGLLSACFASWPLGLLTTYGVDKWSFLNEYNWCDLHRLLQSPLQVEGMERTGCDWRRYSSPIVEGQWRVSYGKGWAGNTERVWGLGCRYKGTYQSMEGIDEGMYTLGDHLNTGDGLKVCIRPFCGVQSVLFL